jgi:hypothetical protein
MSLDQMTGKIIEAAVKLCYDTWLLTFTDQTYACIESAPSWDGDPGPPEFKELDNSDWKHNDLLFKLGVYDAKEYARVSEARKEIEQLAKLMQKYPGKL